MDATERLTLYDSIDDGSDDRCEDIARRLIEATTVFMQYSPHDFLHGLRYCEAKAGVDVTCTAY